VFGFPLTQHHGSYLSLSARRRRITEPRRLSAPRSQSPTAFALSDRNGAMPCLASSSARSVSFHRPRWPDQRQSISWRALASSRRRQRSSFLHRLFVRRAPAVAFPVRHPAGHAAAQILRIGVKLDVARARQRFERGDRGGKLHAVVRSQRLAAAEFLLRGAVDQDRAPAAGAGIARAGAVVQIATLRFT